jgi:hypothetical protein
MSSLFKKKKTKVKQVSTAHETSLADENKAKHREEEDQTELGETHGKIVASLIISKIFVGEVSSRGCAECDELVDRVVGVVYAHFGLPLGQRSLVLGQQQQQQPVDATDRTALKILSEEISQRVVTQLQTEAAVMSDLARVLRTSHHELLEKVIGSEDLKEDLIEELEREMKMTSGGSLREGVSLCLQEVVAVLKSRVYHREGRGGGVIDL